MNSTSDSIYLDIKQYNVIVSIRNGAVRSSLLVLLFGIVVITAVIAPCAALSSPLKPFPVLTVYSEEIVTPNHISRMLQNALVKQYDRWKENYLVEISKKGELLHLYRIAAGVPWRLEIDALLFHEQDSSLQAQRIGR